MNSHLISWKSKERATGEGLNLAVAGFLSLSVSATDRNHMCYPPSPRRRTWVALQGAGPACVCMSTCEPVDKSDVFMMLNKHSGPHMSLGTVFLAI